MRPRPARGFTFVELMITAAVNAIVLAVVYSAVTAQQRAYHDGNRRRASQTAARDALLALERTVSIAGYGMDAPLALDLDRYSVAGNCPMPDGQCPRDSMNRPDELIVYARDPNYWTPDNYDAEPAGHAWRIPTPSQNGGNAVLTATNITVNAHPGDRFANGQILQAVCQGGGTYAYFTIRANTTASGGPLSIPLRASVATDPFLQQDWARTDNATYASMNACFASGKARVFLIERYRFHIRPVPAGVAGASALAQFTPYLVLDPGKDVNFSGGIDAGDETILAEGIETFQVAYVMNALPPRGLTPGTAIKFTQGLVSEATQSAIGMTTLLFPGTANGQPPPSDTVYSASSFYPYSVGPPSADERKTDHQANVVAVRIGIVARSADPEPSGGDPPQLLYNMDDQPKWIDPSVGFARTRVETTIPVRNTYVRGMNDF